MLTTYFIIVDYSRRKTNLMNHKFGQFLTSGFGAAFGFLLIWPFEFLKNQAQSEQTSLGNNAMERLKHIKETYGIRGIFRGYIPGAMSIFLRNGAAMIVMQKVN